MGPIGVFDSGYGGLTILHGIRQVLPEYDYLYLGDNARAPYGSRSFEIIYQFTRQAVLKLFEYGCELVILGCNTASAKALRSIQQHVLPETFPDRRVLGVIRPTVEVIGDLTKSRHVGILATEGTINSRSYEMEIAKLHPDIKVSGQACPLWAAIVEADEADSPGADYFVKKRTPKTFRVTCSFRGAKIIKIYLKIYPKRCFFNKVYCLQGKNKTDVQCTLTIVLGFVVVLNLETEVAVEGYLNTSTDVQTKL